MLGEELGVGRPYGGVAEELSGVDCYVFDDGLDELFVCDDHVEDLLERESHLFADFGESARDGVCGVVAEVEAAAPVELFEEVLDVHGVGGVLVWWWRDGMTISSGQRRKRTIPPSRYATARTTGY